MSIRKEEKELHACPHCGSDVGLFSRETARFAQYYKFNGSPNGYSDIESICKRKTTPLYCIRCGKRVTTLENLEFESTDGEG